MPTVASMAISGLALTGPHQPSGLHLRAQGSSDTSVSMRPAAGHAVGHETVLREQLASFRPLLAQSMVMTSSRDTEPEPHHQFLPDVLVQQAGVALVNARLHMRERASAERERAIADQLRAMNLALERAMTELARSSAAVQHSLDIHNRLTAGEGQEGIARAWHELTGLPVTIEDRHGNLTAWAGPGRPDPYPKPTPARREQTLRRALDARGPVRDAVTGAVLGSITRATYEAGVTLAMQLPRRKR
jgi:hypothetical protein